MQWHRVLTAYLPLRYLTNETWPLKACVNFCSNLRPALSRTLVFPIARVSDARSGAEAFFA